MKPMAEVTTDAIVEDSRKIVDMNRELISQKREIKRLRNGLQQLADNAHDPIDQKFALEVLCKSPDDLLA